MGMNVNVLEAKTNLSKPMQRALDGEEIVLARDGVPLIRLVPIEQPKLLRPIGLGRRSLRADFELESMAALSPEQLAQWHE